MTYLEQLQSPAWKIRRREILIRDKKICSNCNNEELIKNCQIGYITKIESYIQKNFIYNKVLYPSEYTYKIIINSVNESLPFTTFLTSQVRLDEQNALQARIYFEKLSSNNSENSYLIHGIKNEQEWLYARNLHIHHKYYQEGLRPWQYPDNALQTLCLYCHEKLHSTNTIVVLDESGKEKTSYNYCKRCYGIGWFSEYKHVSDGICFRCRGARYEELIS